MNFKDIPKGEKKRQIRKQLLLLPVVLLFLGVFFATNFSILSPQATPSGSSANTEQVITHPEVMSPETDESDSSSWVLPKPNFNKIKDVISNVEEVLSLGFLL